MRIQIMDMMMNPQGLKYQEWKSQEWITTLKMSTIILLKSQKWILKEWIMIMTKKEGT